MLNRAPKIMRKSILLNWDSIPMKDLWASSRRRQRDTFYWREKGSLPQKKKGHILWIVCAIKLSQRNFFPRIVQTWSSLRLEVRALGCCMLLVLYVQEWDAREVMCVQELGTTVEKVSILVSRCRGSYMNTRKARPGKVNALSPGKPHLANY